MRQMQSIYEDHSRPFGLERNSADIPIDFHNLTINFFDFLRIAIFLIGKVTLLFGGTADGAQDFDVFISFLGFPKDGGIIKADHDYRDIIC